MLCDERIVSKLYPTTWLQVNKSEMRVYWTLLTNSMQRKPTVIKMATKTYLALYDYVLIRLNPVDTHSSRPNLKSTLIAYTHLRPGVQNGVFFSDFPNKTVYAILTYPTNLSLLDFIALITHVGVYNQNFNK